MEERNRIVKAYYNPEELKPVACVAKCAAGIAVIGLIGVTGVALSENGRDQAADNADVSAVQLQVAGPTRQHAPGTEQSQQTGVEKKDALERPQQAVYRTAR